MTNPSITDLRRAFQPGQTSAAPQRMDIPGFRQAAVLVPIVTLDSGLHLLMTKRTEEVETHKGQISYPGGMVDLSDNGIAHTALREAEEELGIPSSAVEILGLLNDIPTPTRFIITPIVGIIERLPPLKPNTGEVADILHVPIDFFLDDRNGRMELREWWGRQHELWFYQFGGHLIWGATANITRSLLKKLQLL